MRMFSKALAIVGVLVGVAVSGGTSVSAASTCPVGYTGPGSGNVCVSTETYECTVTNNNQVSINGQNAQGAVSGSASGGSGNTGGVQTGTATNSNGATFNFEITNMGICSAVRTAALVETTPTAPTANTPNTQPAVVAVAEVPAQLANTSEGSNVWLPFIAIGLLTVGVLGIRQILINK